MIISVTLTLLFINTPACRDTAMKAWVKRMTEPGLKAD